MRDTDPSARDSEQVINSDLMITCRMLKDAMSRVYIDDTSRDTGCDFGTRFDDIGMESLEIAELIVELEEILGNQLEIADVEQLETLGDLCKALRAVGELD
jgi:acyl carrier protein